MSGPTPNPSDVFDVKRIRRMVELMQEFDLSVLDLKQGDQRVRLRRGQEPQVTIGGGAMPGWAPTAGPVAPPPPPPSGTESGGPPKAIAAAPAGNTTVIKSPMVGTFYPAPSPESPPFVKVGDRVGPETTVCIIEAMKVFNEIPAEVSGTIVEVLVQRGDPVEYGQALFKVQL